jgi:hypothetical protein
MALALAIVLSFGGGGVQKESSLNPCWTLMRWVAENCNHLDRTCLISSMERLYQLSLWFRAS